MPSRFSNNPPLAATKRLAQLHECDIAVPNGPGIGNVICCSPAVEAYATSIGRSLRILTAPLTPQVGRAPGDTDPYPIWAGNPYVGTVVNANLIDPNIIAEINNEKDDTCQFSHVIENICFAYGVSPRRLRPSLYLSCSEMSWALEYLHDMPRPILCIHPYGKNSPPTSSPWYESQWRELVRQCRACSVIQLGLKKTEQKEIPAFYPNVSLRQAMALIWACDFFVGFDSCFAHVATALEKPAIVLWDVRNKETAEQLKEAGFAAAMMLRWAYPQNKNLLLLGERDGEILSICLETIQRYFTITSIAEFNAAPSYTRSFQQRLFNRQI